MKNLTCSVCPGVVYRDAMVYGHTTTAMHDNEYTPHPLPPALRPKPLGLPTPIRPILTRPSPNCRVWATHELLLQRVWCHMYIQ